MDDNYLDKKLKGILESPPDFLPDDGALLDMQSRLKGMQPDRGDGRRKFIALLWWLPLLLVLWGTEYYYHKSWVLDREMQELNRQLAQLPATDTLIKSEIIYRTDTIYRTIYRDRIAQENYSNGNYPNLLPSPINKLM